MRMRCSPMVMSALLRASADAIVCKRAAGRVCSEQASNCKLPGIASLEIVNGGLCWLTSYRG